MIVTFSVPCFKQFILFSTPRQGQHSSASLHDDVLPVVVTLLAGGLRGFDDDEDEDEDFDAGAEGSEDESSDGDLDAEDEEGGGSGGAEMVDEEGGCVGGGGLTRDGVGRGVYIWKHGVVCCRIDVWLG
jgi:hypothetical protein